MKIAVIGAGQIGMSVALALHKNNFANEVVFCEENAEKAEDLKVFLGKSDA